jgi:DNA helicase-2/ATP-dependent DNA helicase PcrA
MPGSGKTTTLLNILEQELKTTPPHQIAFVSFTKKVIREAQERCFQKLNVHKKEMPFFKTLHALAFSAMGMREYDVVNDDHLMELSKKLGIDLLEHKGQLNPISLYNLSRAKNWSLFEAWQKTFIIHSKPFKQISHIVQEYEAYKKHHDIIDFTDMIDQYNQNGAPLPVKTAFVDEAQDLSQAQWKMVERAFCNVSRLIVAGDDDQCIYAWSGADRKYFLNFDGQKEILNQSYRCPAPIANLGNQISQQIQQRYAKELTGTNKPGKIKYIQSLDECHTQLKQNKNWLILVRNRSDIDTVKHSLITQGVSFGIDHKPFCPEKHFLALTGYQSLMNNMRINGIVAQHLTDCCGLKKLYFEPEMQYSSEDIFKQEPFYRDINKQMSGISDIRLRYYDEVLKTSQSLVKPKVWLTTIHGAKGAECDNVILYRDQSKMTYRSAQIYPDNEHRVFYVGVTRTKETLYLMGHQKRWYYNLPLN